MVPQPTSSLGPLAPPNGGPAALVRPRSLESRHAASSPLRARDLEQVTADLWAWCPPLSDSALSGFRCAAWGPRARVSLLLPALRCPGSLLASELRGRGPHTGEHGPGGCENPECVGCPALRAWGSASASGCPQVTKIFQKKKNSVTYSFRQSFSLYGMQVLLFENQCEWVPAPGVHVPTFINRGPVAGSK